MGAALFLALSFASLYSMQSATCLARADEAKPTTVHDQNEKQAAGIHPNPIEIPRLIMEREA